MEGPSGVPFFLKKKDPEFANASDLVFEKHFNKELTLDSEYFKSLDLMMQCVQKHADVPDNQQSRVCANEYKRLRLSAINNKLFFH